jgi:two-component system chemotaxis sensor kinase CheA
MGICPDIPAEHRQAFLSEAEDHLKGWEQALLDLEANPTDRELLNGLFRSVHTLKGCAGFVGCEVMLELTHELESVLQRSRDQGQAFGPQVIELMFEGLDLAKGMVAAMAADGEFDGDLGALLARARSLTGQRPAAEASGRPEAAPAPQGSPAKQGAAMTAYRLVVEIVAEPKEAYLRALLIRSKLEDVGKIQEIVPPLEDLRIREGDFRFQVALESALDAAQLRRQVDIDQVNVLSVRRVGSEPEQQAAAPGGSTGARTPGPAAVDEIVRVPVDKLDAMMNLVGELVVQNSGFLAILKACKAEYGKSALLADLEQQTDALGRTAHSLQDAVMKVRMLPVATIFSRFARVVRDLAKHRGKQIELEIFGEQTEIDKKVIDRIGEPLIHLLRNAVDHGIEAASDRVAYGKDPSGHVRVGAYQEGDRICIEVRDDGAGLDRGAICAVAESRGLATREKLDQLSDEEVFEFIFLPGFSTARELTEVSGRGVGLDVVRKTVEEMGGSVRLQSTLGLGVCTTITLPLTMAIINALLVEAAGIRFAIPLAAVREVLQTRRGELRHFERNQVIRLREEVLAVLELPKVLGLAEAESQPAGDGELAIVIVDYGSRKIGLTVGRLKGREQVVIKSLTRNFRPVEGLAGATILGDGKIALILDVRGLLDGYYRDNQADFLFTKVLEDNRRREAGEEPARGPAAPEEPAGPAELVGPPGPAPGARPGRAEKPARSRKRARRKAVATEVPAQPAEAAPPQRAYAPQPAEPPAIPWRQADLARFDEILVGGAVNASRALSDLLNKEFRVSFPETKILPLGAVASALGGEELPVCGVLVGIGGDIDGGSLLLLPLENALGFCDLLLGREAGATGQLGEEEVSALRETGNILSASFVGALADETGLDVRLRVPEARVDMCLAVVDSVLAGFSQPGAHAFLIEADVFYADREQVVCNLLMMLERSSLELLMGKVTGGSERGEDVERS